MDQKSSFHEQAKQILNDNSHKVYTDQEANQIIDLLDVFANIMYHNLTQNHNP